MHGSDSYRAKVRRERTLNSRTFEFFFLFLRALRSRVRGIFQQRALEYIESYVVLAEQQSRIPYMWRQKFGRFDQALSTGGFRIFRLFSSSLFPSATQLSPSGASNIYVSLFKKKKELTARTHMELGTRLNALSALCRDH